MPEPGRAAELLRGAREDLARGFAVRAGTRLRQAAQTGDSGALHELVRTLLDGRIPGGSSEARRWLERPDGNLEAAPRFLRATLRFRGIGGGRDENGALEDLVAAAQAGLSAARIELAMLWQEHSGAEARASARGWLAQTDDIPARELQRTVAHDGPLSEPPSPPEWADPPSPPGEQLCAAPRIVTHAAALSPPERAWLIGQARPVLAPSRVFDPRTGKAHADTVRTSETMCFEPSRPSVFARRLEARLARLAGRDPACAEPLVVMRYRPGQEYKPHHDGLGARALARDGLRAAGDRVATVLAYLNTPEDGGATTFPGLKLTVAARAGNALEFANLDESGEPLPLALHAGEPVASGEKWLASLWIRARPLRF